MNSQLRTPTRITLRDAEALRQEDLREEYEEFSRDCSRDLSSIETEYGGIITFKEWLADKERETKGEDNDNR